MIHSAFLALLAFAGQSAPPSSPPIVGVVPDACAVLPPVPPIVADYLARAGRAKTAGEAAPPVSEQGMAIYRRWQDDLRLADFAGLCRYRAANAALPPAGPRRTVFFGDSITEFWAREDPAFFGADRIDRGISGQTTTQMLARFRADVIDLKPAIVHIMAGTNDIAGNTGPTTLAAIEDNIRSMVELARAHHIRVILGSVLPARRFDWRPSIEPIETIRALNAWLATYAHREKLTFVDYYSAMRTDDQALRAELSADGVHPNKAGYGIMRGIADKALRF